MMLMAYIISTGPTLTGWVIWDFVRGSHQGLVIGRLDWRGQKIFVLVIGLRRKKMIFVENGEEGGVCNA